MNDNELDLMLREHGNAFRDEHAQRPAVDWDVVTTTKRSPKLWLGVVAVAAAAAAVIVPLAVVGGSKPAAKPAPATKVPLKIAEKGAPPAFFAIAAPDASGNGGATAYVSGVNNYDSTKLPHNRGVALGVAPDGLTAYTAYPVSGCRTYFARNYEHLNKKPIGVSGTADLTTLPGLVQRTTMAVSPDGKQLAFVVYRAGPNCARVQRLEVYNLITKTTKSWGTSASYGIEDLVWAPDGKTLLYQLIGQCLTNNCKGSPGTQLGTYALNTTTADYLRDSTFVLPEKTDAGDGDAEAPVFYWHGQLVALYNGSVRRVANTALGTTIATGFPASVVGVSVDLTGDHLLLVGAPVLETGIGNRAFTPNDAYSNDRMIVTTKIYRWDNGRVSAVPGNWLDPAW